MNNKVYSCPMHPEIKRDAPGMCPECGMNLLPTGERGKSFDVAQDKPFGEAQDKPFGEAQGKHAGHHTEEFLKKFWISLLLTIPVLLYSDIIQKFFGWNAPRFPGSDYLPLIFSSIIFFYCGLVFLAGAYRELKARSPGMMTLIGVAISAAYLWSVYAVFSGEAALFWELATLVTIMLLGHWMEMRAVSGAQGALKELSKLLPDTAEVIRNGKAETIPLEELKEGDFVFVRPGGRVPSDGVVADGKSDVNESLITGESVPVDKVVGSEVIAGSINGEGSLKIKVTKVGERTFLSGIARLVQEAQASKSRLQILSDRAAFYLTLIAVIGGIATFLAWMFARGEVGFAMARMVAVLVIACPHALGLAVPLVASISTTLAARQGFLVKQRIALETARSVDTVLFDKTGTLTKGEYGITDIWVVGAENETELLALAASVDSHSEHFISKAIVAKALEKQVAISEAKDFSRIPGRGVRGVVNGKEIFVGGVAMAEERGAVIPENLKKTVGEEGKKGKTIIYAIENKKLLGVFSFADIIRDESRQAVQKLSELGVRVAMITGDSEDVAAWVSKELGIKKYFSRVLPDQKSEKVKELQSAGQKVAMVGDGINDAPALTQADLGVAIGAGTNVAIESAGIILVRNDPRDIAKIIRLSRRVYSKMIQNLFWATGYNIVALPLAAGVLYARGILLQPALAALFMSLSTVIVAVNAILLKRKMI